VRVSLRIEPPDLIEDRAPYRSETGPERPYVATRALVDDMVEHVRKPVTGSLVATSSS
jgi:hypothetical protein